MVACVARVVRVNCVVGMLTVHFGVDVSQVICVEFRVAVHLDAILVVHASRHVARHSTHAMWSLGSWVSINNLCQ